MKDIKEYNHLEIESKHSQRWLSLAIHHCPNPSQKNRFSVVIPPPNVTGSLHMGHALNITLQDIICRWQRMLGKDVVWVPGFDHAGIATQYVVDKKIQEEGKNRLEMGREEFLRRVWEWVPQSRNSIRDQLIKLGASVDWKRERFTLDEGFSRLVRHAFKKLYEEGLIYRGEYIVNWCPKDLTALSDLEVEHEEEEGKLYYIKYPLEGDEGYITVATTRPETMLGDTAVAVHPEDERYKALIGKKVKLPLTNRVIPIIADERVKPEFGTGAVKVTPAHDPLDFEIGRTHGLEVVQIMDEFARINENGGEFAGLDRYEARKKIVEKLSDLGLLEKVENHRHSVGKCYRCKTVLEPMVSTQWFVKVSDPRIKERAVQAVIGYIQKKERELNLQILYTQGLEITLKVVKNSQTKLVVFIKEGVEFVVGKKDGEISYIYVPEGREDLVRIAKEVGQRLNKANLIVKAKEGMILIREGSEEKLDGSLLLVADQEGLKLEENLLEEGEVFLEAVQKSLKVKWEREKKVWEEEKRVRFVPENWKKIYLQWMENLRDWCISRQIWWGHRIPVWYCKDCGHINVFTDDDFDRVYDKLVFNLLADGKIKEEFTPEEVEAVLKSPSFVHPELTVLEFYKRFVFHKYHSTDVSAHSLRLFFTQDLNPTALLTNRKGRYKYNVQTKKYRFMLYCKKCGSENLEWDKDVLDTWFSSALWPFGVFGFPENTQELKSLYPTNLLITGFDIIFFWVARMIMMGMFFMEDIPFEDVYIHALVRDEKGQKMSKTKGNVIDPLDIIEKYGADALRFTLAILTQQGRDIRLSEKRFEGYKHFANKLWNAGRFILLNLDEDLLSKMPYMAPPRWEDLWILTLLNETIQKVNKALEEYEFSLACQSLYDFVWSEFCDWYIEMSKLRLYAKAQSEEEKEKVEKERITAQAFLLMVFDRILKLLHPFIPFITEELYHHLPSSTKESISLESYPEYNPQEVYPEAKEKLERLKQIITSIRALRSDLRIEPSKKIKLFYRADQSAELVRMFEDYIKVLAKVEELIEVSDRPSGCIAGFSKDFEFFIPVEGNINVQELLQSYSRKLSEVEKSLDTFQRRLENRQFLEKAPEEELEKVRKAVQELSQERDKIKSLIELLEEVMSGSKLSD
ncbi:class I tRNA ligase family protein [Thermocrinis sp.]